MLRRVRELALVSCTIFGIVACGISSNIPQDDFMNLGLSLAVGVMVMMICGTALAIDAFRRGVFTSWTSVELGWMGMLWMFSSAAGAVAISDWGSQCRREYCVVEEGPSVPKDCTPVGPSLTSCRQMQAIAAFSLVNGVILFIIWSWTLYIFIRAQRHGDPFIWTSPAHEYEFKPTFPKGDRDAKMMPDGDIPLSDRPVSRTPSPSPDPDDFPSDKPKLPSEKLPLPDTPNAWSMLSISGKHAA